MSDIAIAILAAGMSTRLGRPKQLLPLAGRPIVEHVARRARASKADRVLAVIGAARDATENLLENTLDEIVINEFYPRGQGVSIAAAVRYLIGTDDLFGTCDAVVIVLGDQPAIDTAVIDAVIDAWRSGAGIVMAKYSDRAGHPVLFDRQYWSELVELDGDEGGRAVIARHEANVHYVQVESPSPMDVDTDLDWRRLQEMWAE
jgi:molybdenum cofactor cytidylyltransferase